MKLVKYKLFFLILQIDIILNKLLIFKIKMSVCNKISNKMDTICGNIEKERSEKVMKIKLYVNDLNDMSVK